LMKRCFNPAELIARELGRAFNKPIIAQLATRSHSREQKALNRRQRINNVGWHFHATRKTLNGEHIMLIDDVMTTGSTAHSMALILKSAGASNVGIWCLARTPKH
jgi:predicted amidophosphoribosyltransferase